MLCVFTEKERAMMRLLSFLNQLRVRAFIESQLDGDELDGNGNETEQVSVIATWLILTRSQARMIILNEPSAFPFVNLPVLPPLLHSNESAWKLAGSASVRMRVSELTSRTR